MVQSAPQEASPPQVPSASLADLAGAFDRAEPGPGLSAAAWVKVAVLGALFVAVNYWQFNYLINKWRDDANWSHGFLIPLFSLYLLYTRRGELAAAARRTCLWGLLLTVVSILLIFWGFCVMQRPYYSELALVGLLLSLVLYQAGPRILRIAWVPVAYLVLAMPIPNAAYDRIAVPLQKLAAHCSGAVLSLCGARVDVRRKRRRTSRGSMAFVMGCGWMALTRSNSTAAHAGRVSARR